MLTGHTCYLLHICCIFHHNFFSRYRAEEIQAEPEGNPTVESLALSMAAATSACMIGNWIASALPPQFSGQFSIAQIALIGPN